MNNQLLDLEQHSLGYSAKNIPLPPKGSYLNKLVIQAEKFIRNFRWRTFFFLNPDITPDQKEIYGFPSPKSPPSIQQLNEFEDGLAAIIDNIEFKKVKNHFQKKLNDDINRIRNSEQLCIPSDKTTNFYNLSPTQYNQLLEKSVHKEYKKTGASIIEELATKDKSIAESLSLADRIKATVEKQPFITLKDHKDNFKHNPTCRPINPCKPEIGKISKQILERIVKDIRIHSDLNLWRSTSDVINWFECTHKKPNHSFINFDVCDFYPSITEKLLNQALSFASEHTAISSHEIEVIKHTKKTLLFHMNEPWIKKSGTFDVTMGSYDGAETCELIGLFMLSKLNHLNINCGLYRDDGLALCDLTPRQAEITKKEICRIFKTFDLNVTIQANKKIVDFLDITLNVASNTYEPYMKKTNTLLYINKNSNHPPSIIRNIPRGINTRISTNSKNETLYNKAKKKIEKSQHLI